MTATSQNTLSQETASPAPQSHPLLKAVSATWKHWKLATLFFVMIMLLVVVGAFVSPKSYRSEAKLFVRMGRESVTLDPTATTGQIVSVYESRENEINSVIEVIQSRVILEQVVEKIGAQRILHGTKTTESVMSVPSTNEKSSPMIPQTTLGKDVSKNRMTTVKKSDIKEKQVQEKAIRKLEKTIYTTHAKKSSVITIGCKATSPELAQLIVDEVLNAFHDLHLRVNRTAGSEQFFAAQMELSKKKFDKATLKLQKKKNKLGVVSLVGRKSSLQQQIRDNQIAISKNSTDLAAAEAFVVTLKKTVEQLPTNHETQRVKGSPNGAADRVRQQLNELKIRERQLRTRFTMHHQDVIAIHKQIQEAESILKTKESNGTQSTTGTNPASQQLNVRFLTEQARATSLQAASNSLQANRQRLQKELEKLNAEEGQIALLTQNVELLRMSHRTYSEKYEQSRIDGALGEQRISNVNVVQPATYITKPVSPAKRIIVLLGFFIAFIGAIGVAFLAEVFGKKQTDQLHQSASTHSTNSDVVQATHLEPVVP